MLDDFSKFVGKFYFFIFFKKLPLYPPYQYAYYHTTRYKSTQGVKYTQIIRLFESQFLEEGNLMAQINLEIRCFWVKTHRN